MTGECEIELEGVRVHNLKNIRLKIRHGLLTVICGVSGSGKSSLAFDTLYAEGQRRYIETFSPYARQFLDRVERPAADRIDGIPPAIAVRQHQRMTGQRSTVGTRTEIIDSLRSLFLRAGQLRCPECGLDVNSDTPQSVADAMLLEHSGSRVLIAFQVSVAVSVPIGTVSSHRQVKTGRPQAAGDVLTDVVGDLQRRGFQRILCGNSILRLDQLTADADGVQQFSEGLAQSSTPPPLTVILDRLRVESDSAVRLAESVATAIAASAEQECVIFVESGSNKGREEFESQAIEGQMWRTRRFSAALCCNSCQRSFQEPTPESLNFNSVIGACPRCTGMGEVPATDAARQTSEGSSKRRRTQNARAPRVICPDCQGTRLRPDACALQLAGKTLCDLCDLEVSDLAEWISATADSLPDNVRRSLRSVILHLTLRLGFLRDCGLGYLTIGRRMATLAGGEHQRVMLTSALGSGLINTLYVLDEPTSGLHASDTARIIRTVRQLTAAGNTVVVVEHDAAFLRAADEVIEIGPGGGALGGQVIFQGQPEELHRVAGSPTGTRLAQSDRKASPRSVRDVNHWLGLTGVHCQNLINLDVRLPLGVLCAVTGVSGSGKSSLIARSLFPAVCRMKGLPYENIATAGVIRDIDGAEHIDHVMLLDQQPLRKSSRSMPATWIGVFGDIRRLLAETHEARKRNYTAGTFSFNSSAGGRCPLCEGRGRITVEMQFLADIETTCEECEGQRFRSDVLDVRFRDRTVHEILQMTADDAFSFFNGHHRIQQRLNAIRQAGLGYLRLGQPLSTLSGGEAQRLRIAALLAGVPFAEGETAPANRRAAGISGSERTLFLFDEPSTGLHAQDIDSLMICFNTLVETGHSVMIIEHDEYLLCQMDYRIELGPGPGRYGGRVVYSGSAAEYPGNPVSPPARNCEE